MKTWSKCSTAAAIDEETMQVLVQMLDNEVICPFPEVNWTLLRSRSHIMYNCFWNLIQSLKAYWCKLSYLILKDGDSVAFESISIHWRYQVFLTESSWVFINLEALIRKLSKILLWLENYLRYLCWSFGFPLFLLLTF